MPIEHIVQQGDCVGSIAFDHGFFWETLWKEASNAGLRERRQNPNVLLEGDVLYIPDRRLKEEAGATEKCHRFRLKGVPAVFRLRLTEQVPGHLPAGEPSPPVEEDATSVVDELTVPVVSLETKPRADLAYRLVLDGLTMEGRTNRDGVLEHRIPPNARSGELILEPGTVRETRYPLRLGYLDPLTEITGVKQRLANLGFECGERSEQETDEFAAALAAFQEAAAIPITGKLDETSRHTLREAHGL